MSLRIGILAAAEMPCGLVHDPGGKVRILYGDAHKMAQALISGAKSLGDYTNPA